MPLTELAGNRPLKEQLLPRLRQGGLSHAYILAGPAGSGKGTLAKILARAMVCSGSGVRPCNACPACRKAAEGIHPDVITVEPLEQGKQILVDQVRQLRADAYIRPNEADRKVYVIRPAEQMNENAQNAMLKLLEEGPDYAAFLLLTENEGSLLTTVRSRCETLHLTAPEGQTQPAQDEAGTLLDQWLAGDVRALMDWCAAAERWERVRFVQLLDELYDQLALRLRTQPDRRRLLQAAAVLDQLRQAEQSNVGAAHLAGWLCAAAQEEA